MNETPNKKPTKPSANHQATAVEHVDTPAAAPIQPALSLEALSGLFFDVYKHLTTLALISAGGLITLTQAGMIAPEDHKKMLTSAALLFGAAMLSFFTGFTWLAQCEQWHYFPEKYQAEIEARRAGKGAISARFIMTMMTLFLFGIGIGTPLMILFE